jgi:integrase
MKGHVRERGKGNWYAVIDIRDPTTNRRRRKWHSLEAQGKRQAQIECAALIAEMDAGAYIETDKTSLNNFLDRWERDWAATNVSPKTAERYSQLLKLHIRPMLGAKPMQAIRAQDLNALYTSLHDKLAPRTVGHVHRLLHLVFGHATKWGNIKRNVVALVDAPKVPPTEAPVLQLTEIPQMFDAVRGRGYSLYPIAVVALGTGMRRGELCALRWQDVNLDAATLRVERSLEQTRKSGLRFKEPKSARGRRTISLSPAVVAELRKHWAVQQEQRLSLGLGGSPPDGLVFADWDGSAFAPDRLSDNFADTMEAAGLPHVTLHTLRHTHASQLIRSGVDILTVSRRLGHATATVTLNVYGHIIATEDKAAEITQAMFDNAGVGK